MNVMAVGVLDKHLPKRQAVHTGLSPGRVQTDEWKWL